MSPARRRQRGGAWATPLVAPTENYAALLLDNSTMSKLSVSV